MGPRGSLYPRPQARGDSRIDVAVLPRKWSALNVKSLAQMKLGLDMSRNGQK